MPGATRVTANIALHFLAGFAEARPSPHRCQERSPGGLALSLSCEQRGLAQQEEQARAGRGTHTVGVFSMEIDLIEITVEVLFNLTDY